MSEYIITTEQLNWFLERMDETVAIPASIAHLKPIMRCKDCKFFGYFEDGNEKAADEYCCHWASLGVEPDCFCAWGERREVSE